MDNDLLLEFATWVTEEYDVLKEIDHGCKCSWRCNVERIWPTPEDLIEQFSG